MLNRCDRRAISNPLNSMISVVAAIAIATLLLGLSGCGDPESVVETDATSATGANPPAPPTEIVEVSPPRAIAELKADLDRYRPQVTIVRPRPEDVLQDSQIDVELTVRDLPVFQNETYGLGPYVQLYLDESPLPPIYDLDAPVRLDDLAAGTHTLRAFAVRPWHESFKNEGAYAQTTFHVYTQTGNNRPDPDLPLLTYNRPREIYGAEPILLDFYLTNAPLHLVAQESEEDEIPDWRVRATINGFSFITDRWQPFYLSGFQPGRNWVKLEFLDETGEPLRNTFNTTATAIVYDPTLNEPLTQLVTGELSAKAARGIVDPDVKPEPEPAIPPEPAIEPKDTLPEVVEPDDEIKEEVLPDEAESLESELEKSDTEEPVEEPDADLNLPPEIPDTPAIEDTDAIEPEPIPQTPDQPSENAVDKAAETAPEMPSDSSEADTASEPEPAAPEQTEVESVPESASPTSPETIEDEVDVSDEAAPDVPPDASEPESIAEDAEPTDADGDSAELRSPDAPAEAGDPADGETANAEPSAAASVESD